MNPPQRFTSACLAVVMAMMFGAAARAGDDQTPESWRKIQAAGPKLELIGRMATRSANEIKATPWSVGCETMDRDYTVYDNYRAYLGPLGAKAARIQAGWGKCEPVKGQYNFAWLDHVIDDMNAQGVRPWVCICYGNEIYEGGGTRLLGGKLPTSDEALAAWRRWVEAMVRRYQGKVLAWEVWNEPNLGQGANKDQRLGEYVRLYELTADTIRAIDPKVKLWAVASTSPGAAVIGDFLEAMKQRDKLDLVDEITYHAYSARPEDIYPGVEKLQALVAGYSDRITIRQGESGCPSVRHEVHALSKKDWTEYNQTKWYLRRMLGDRVRDIPSSVFSIVDIRYPNVLLSMGLLKANDDRQVLYRKPAYYAVQHLMTLLDADATPMKVVEVKALAAEHLMAAGFTRNNKPLVFVWNAPPGVPTDDLTWTPIDLTLKSITFDDPVYVELMSGHVYALNPGQCRRAGSDTVLTGLPVRDSPVLITERHILELKR